MEYLENKIYLEDIKIALQQTVELEKLKRKRILVLGATGLIGSFLVDCLRYANTAMGLGMQVIAAGRNKERLVDRFGNQEKNNQKDNKEYRVTTEKITIGSCEVRSSQKQEEYFGWKEATENVQLLECDVTELDMHKLKETGLAFPDIIIHAASGAYPKAFRETPVEVMLANFLGVHKVLELARKNPGSRVLFVSSGEAQEEVDHLSVRGCYPVSKKAAETLCLSYLQEYQTDVVIARPCHTFGPNVTTVDNRATAQFIECAVRNEDIVLKSAGQQVRSFAYVADCVSGLLTVLTCGEAGAVYGVAADESCSIREFAEYCAKAVRKQVTFVEGTNAEKAEVTPIMEQIVENEELKKLGWKPKYTIAQGIKRSINIRK